MAHHGQNGVSAEFNVRRKARRLPLAHTGHWLRDNYNGGGKGSGPWATLTVRWLDGQARSEKTLCFKRRPVPDRRMTGFVSTRHTTKGHDHEFRVVLSFFLDHGDFSLHSPAGPAARPPARTRRLTRNRALAKDIKPLAGNSASSPSHPVLSRPLGKGWKRQTRCSRRAHPPRHHRQLPRPRVHRHRNGCEPP